MTVSQTKETYIYHLQKLADRWENLLEVESFSNKKYYELYERSKHILSQVSPHDKFFLDDKLKSASQENIERLIGKLRAAQFDLNDGILSLEHHIQNEIALDLMQQAEQLLTTDSSGPYEHIPAAVLAGAVLEHFLRTLCNRQSPPIPLNLDNGNPKTLGVLVNELEKIGLYNTVERKQLKVWVEIRNAAAHGQFNEFTYKQTTEMLKDIKDFIEIHR